jgi:hypothetical protein
MATLEMEQVFALRLFAKVGSLPAFIFIL